MHLFYQALLVGSIFFHVDQLNQNEVRFDSTDFAKLSETALQEDFQGTMLIFEGNQLVFDLHRGSANSSSLNNSEIRYNICSNGKVLTSLLIFKEIEKGNLNLDGAAASYLNSEDYFQGLEQISIRQLLNHTSGLGDFFESPEYQEENINTVSTLYPLVQRMPVTKNQPLEFLHYSNSGFIVLGKILERIHLKPYEQILQEELLLPLGIDLTVKKSYAQGWIKDEENWKLGLGNNPESWSSAGGVFLSPTELHQVLSALNAGKILSKNSIETMWAISSRPEHNPPFVGYGLGWMIEQPKNLRFIGHNGGIPGFQSGFRYLPESDTYIYVFSNRDGGAEKIFMTAIMQLIEKAE